MFLLEASHVWGNRFIHRNHVATHCMRCFTLIILLNLQLQNFRLSAKESLILRSFRETRQRRVHVSIHSRTQKQEHPCSALLGLTSCSHTDCWSRMCSDCPWIRAVMPGPAELSGFWHTGSATLVWPLSIREPAATTRAGMSRSSEESHSRGGGSESDLKMASSCNTSPEGGPPAPLHQSRIRQVGIRVHRPNRCRCWSKEPSKALSSLALSSSDVPSCRIGLF